MPLEYEIIPVTDFEQNCSVLWCSETRKAAIVDPGGDLETIERFVLSNELEMETILITHAHIDHAGAAADAAERFGVPIEGPHIDDKFWIDGLEEQSRMFNFPPSRPFAPSRWLSENDQVSVGNQRLKVIHCPGHTPGHVVFYSAEAKLAIVGDVLFRGSIGRTDFPRGNHQDLIDSIKLKLLPLGDDIEFIPGHGPMSTFGVERKHNPFF